MPSIQEIQQLVANWIADPCWDLETTEGFEQFHDQLLQVRLRKEAEWNDQYAQRVNAKASLLNCSPELAEYIMTLEQKLERIDRYLLER